MNPEADASNITNIPTNMATPSCKVSDFDVYLKHPEEVNRIAAEWHRRQREGHPVYLKWWDGRWVRDRDKSPEGWLPWE